MDEDEKKQTKEHIRTLEYVLDELIMQYRDLDERISNLKVLINKEKIKLKGN